MTRAYDSESLPLRDKHGTVNEQKAYMEEQDTMIEADSENGHESAGKQFTTRKVVLTTVVVSSWVVRGLASEIPGPTMQELLQRTGISYKDMLLSMNWMEITRVLVLIPLGIVQERVRRYSFLQASFGILCYLLSMCLLPRATSLLHLDVAFGVLGVAEACSVNSGFALILDIWKERAAAPMQILVSGCGLGALLIPEIVSVFIPNSNTYVPATTDAPTNCAPLETGNVSNNSFVQHSYPIDNAYYSVTIISAVCAVALIVCQVSEHWCGDRNGSVSEREAERHEVKDNPRLSVIKDILCSPQANTVGKMCLVGLVVVLSASCNMQAGATQRMYGRLASVFGLRFFCFSLKDSLSLGTVYFSAYTLGGIVFALLHFLDITIVIAIQVTGFMLGSVCMYFGGSFNVATAMVIIGLVGFFTGPMFASSFMWMDSLLYVKGSYLTIVNTATPLGTLTYLSLTGWLLQHEGPRSVLTLGIAASVVLSISGCFMIVISCVTRRKHSNGKLLLDEQNEKQDESSNESNN